MASATHARTAPSPEPRAAYQPLVLLLAAASGGAVGDVWLSLAAGAWWCGAAGLLALWLVCFVQRWERAGSCVLLAAVLCTGGAWRHDRWHLFPADEVGLMIREEIRPLCCEAVALTAPRWAPAPPATALRSTPKGDESELQVQVTRVRDGGQWRAASGWATLEVDGHLLGVRPGDRLRVFALASRPQPVQNPGEFDYAAWERSRRSYCRLRGLFPESVQVLERGPPWSLRGGLGYLREAGNALLRRHISYERATLAAAVLLGAREQLDPERNEGFLVTGTIHILSISGLHVGILAYGFWSLFRTGLLPRTATLWGAIGCTWLYCLLTDAQPPVLRASILVTALCLARLWRRPALGFNTLAAAGLAVLAVNPASLFLAGPQLSFLAVAVMIVFRDWLTAPHTTDPLERLLATSQPWAVRWFWAVAGEAWRVWLTGAVIWAISLPLVWRQYGLVSPSALAINALVWLPIALALYSGFGVLLAAELVPGLAGWLGGLCDLSLWATEVCIAWGQALPGGYFWLPPPPGWCVALFYAGFGLVALLPRGAVPVRWGAGLLLAWLAGALWLSSLPADVAPAAADEVLGLPPPAGAKAAESGSPAGATAAQVEAAADERPLACTFMAVGHGLSVLLELPDGKALLYDAGKLGGPLGAVRPISATLWSRGRTHLDGVFISHADSDHFNGLPQLLDRFSVGAVYVSPVMFAREQPAVRELRAALDKFRPPVQSLRAADTLHAGAATVQVLHPLARGVIGSDNANSMVLLVEYAGRRILLPGDLESPGLDDLLREESLPVEIALAPHHGSARSDPRGFTQWCTPRHVVISGARDVEDLPALEAVKQSYRSRGALVHHTAEVGAVRFEVRPSGVRWLSYRPRSPFGPTDSAAAGGAATRAPRD